MNLLAISEVIDLVISMGLITVGILIQFIPIFEKKFKNYFGNSPLSKLLCNRYAQLVAGFFLILSGLKRF